MVRVSGSSIYRGFELPRVNYSKCRTEIQGKSILVRVSTRFKFNSEGSSYRELTVLLFSCNPIGQLFPGGPGYSSCTCKMTSVNSTFKHKEA